nr:phage/plasmid replication protein, II/X family [Rhodanobacter sp. MP7CTX1]
MTFLAPCAHAHAIDGGQVLSLAPGGELQWMSRKRASVRGSFDTCLTIRTATHTPEPLTHVEISGNPVKFFQGHNLWGSDDVHALVVHTLDHLSGLGDLGLLPTAEDRAAWLSGDVRLTRVDQTQSYHLGNLSDVLAWLRAAEQTAHLSHRGRGQLVKGSTLYFGQHSRRWSLKLYAKGQEIRDKGHRQEMILDLPHALAWADRTLRAELVLRSMELRRLGLDMVTAWSQLDGVDSAVTARLLQDRLGAMTMNTVAHLSASVLDSLRPSLRMAYQSWEAGCDLRAIVSRPTFYRYRADLLPHGIDIAALNPKERSNVVPLVRVLEAVPAPVPDWAHGTHLYWEPRRIA